MIKRLYWETANARWSVELFQTPTGFRCKYFGTTPKFAQVKSPTGPTAMMADMGRGEILGDDAARLLEQVRGTVEAIDGTIEKETDRSP
jgi:hypothetical protein